MPTANMFQNSEALAEGWETDPSYNPLNNYAIFPTAFEIERHAEKGKKVTNLKEEWEIIIN